MSRALKLLLVEDSDDDAILVREELISAGYDVAMTRVQTPLELRAALGEKRWDIVVTDFSLPSFNAIDALALISSLGVGLPCIVVSGAIGEEAAVALMKAGASDFVSKQSLSRLPPAIERSLREVEAWRDRSEAILALRESETRFKALADNIPGMVFQSILHPDGTHDTVYVSEGCMAVFGITPASMLANPDVELQMIHPDDRQSYQVSSIDAYRREIPRNWEGRILVGVHREPKWINLRAVTRRLPNGVVMSEGIINNITESKLAEERLRASREQLRQLSIHADKVRESERAHIAREIHDDLGGTLTAAKMALAWIRKRLAPDSDALLEKVEDIDSLLDSVIDSARRLSRRLHPLVLDHGLIAAVEWQARDFTARTGIEIDVACPHDEMQLAPDVSTALFRIFQETLTNIARHAESTKGSAELVSDGDVVTLIVQDNGRGLDSNATSKQGSFGLRGMRERVDSLGGEFEIHSRPGEGTRIEVNIPLLASNTSIADVEPVTSAVDLN